MYGPKKPTPVKTPSAYAWEVLTHEEFETILRLPRRPITAAEIVKRLERKE